MFEITAYSVFTIILFLSCFLALFMYITSKSSILSRVPIWLLLAIVSIIVLRFIIPVEVTNISIAINSFVVMPVFKNFICYEIGGQSILFYIKLIWLLGIIAFILNYTINYIKFVKGFKYIPSTEDIRINSIVSDIKNKYKFNFDVKIISNEIIDSPAEFGYINKTIIIDSQRYGDDELYYIFLHELTHFYIKTNWIKLFVNIINCIFWWNPVFYMLDKYVDNLIEIAVDRFIFYKEASAIEYMRAISVVLKKSSSNSKMRFARQMAAAEGSFTLKRVKLMACGVKPNQFICGIIFVSLITALLFTTRFVIQSAYEPEYVESSDGSEFTAENSYIIKEGNMYYFYYNDEVLIADKDINNLPKINE